MRDLTLNEFSEKLFSKEAVPGGGGASALVGALAISLGAMAANLTLGKEKYAEYTDELNANLEKAEKLRLRLLELIEEDATGFGEINKAYKVKPRDEELIEKALVSAATPPLKMMEAIKEVIDILIIFSDKTSVLVVSDVGVGAKFAEAALKSAYLNVVVNAALMKDEKTATEIEEKADKLLHYAKKADEVYENIVRQLRDK